jgi:hypothetical protein
MEAASTLAGQAGTEAASREESLARRAQRRCRVLGRCFPRVGPRLARHTASRAEAVAARAEVTRTWTQLLEGGASPWRITAHCGSATYRQAGVYEAPRSSLTGGRAEDERAYKSPY